MAISDGFVAQSIKPYTRFVPTRNLVGIAFKQSKERRMSVNPHNLPLESEAVEYIEATSVPQLFYQVPPTQDAPDLTRRRAQKFSNPKSLPSV